MKISENYKALLAIFAERKILSISLFVLMVISSLTESLGLAMIVPLFEKIMHSDSELTVLKHYLPFFNSIGSDNEIIAIIGCMVGLIVLKNVFIMLRTWLSYKFTFDFRALWMKSIFNKYLYSEYGYLLKQKQGTLLHNLTQEPVFAAAGLQQILDFLSQVILSVFLFLVILFLNWKLTLELTAGTALIALFFRKKANDYSINVGSKRIQNQQDLSAIAAESIHAIRQVKIFSKEKEIDEDFSSKINQFNKIIVKFRVVSAVPQPLGETILGFLTLALLLFFQINHHQGSLKDIIPRLAAFIVIGQRLIPKICSLYSQNMNLITFIPSLKEVQDLYLSIVPKEDLYTGENIHSLSGNIRFEDVVFYYEPSKELFRNLSCCIEQGGMTAIVGPSGSGKSTFVDLLCGLVKKKSGKILINDKDINQISLHSLRGLIGYVSQDTFLFNSTVRENILVAKPEASDEEMKLAAQKAHADIFIQKLPHGYETVLGERGATLSGGERQRIAIARIILRNPEIIIFDEATSALDKDTEIIVQDNLKELFKNKTVIIITHRLELIKNADKVIVLKDGEIIRQGKAQALINDEGIYKILAQH